MSLAQKALSGFIWTAITKFGSQGIQFLVLIVLARLLVPADFGLVAILMGFFAVSKTLIDSGFAQAIIREKEISEEDKSTTFFLNLFVALGIYFILWFSAPAIATFFNQTLLVDLLRFMALLLIFQSITIVQQATFTQELKFKSIMYIEMSAVFITGILAIILAYLGYGVWALALKFVANSFFNALFFYVANPWYPKTFIHKSSFDKLFGFGSKLMVSGLLNSAFTQLYTFVIAKFFSMATLGFYAKAMNFRDIFSRHLINTLQKVTYPILSKTNDNPDRLKSGYLKIIQITSFLIFPALLGLALVAEPLIKTTIGDSWMTSVPMLQLLCLSGMLYHLHSINLNILKVVGRSDLFLRLEIIKKIMTVIAVAVSLPFGIWGLLIGQVVNSYLGLFVNMYYTTTFLNYSIYDQFKDIIPILLLSVPMMVVVFGLQLLLNVPAPIELIIMTLAGVIVYVLTNLIIKPEPLSHVIALLKPRIPLLNKVGI